MNAIALSPEQTLIPVFQADIGGILVNACDARLLHKFLEVGKDFSSWIKLRIKQYGFTQDVDFKAHQNGGGLETTTYVGDKIEYILTLDMGKELSMVEKNDKGRQARKYFIDCERLVIEALTKSQYALKELPTLPAPRAKIYVKGGLELHQQDAINDFIKERVAIVPTDKRKGITVMIYSAICIKFDVKGMTHGYKNIAPEQFDNIIQLIARLPIHDEKAMLFFTQDELDNLIAERVKAIEGEVMPKEQTIANSDLVNILTGRVKALESELSALKEDLRPNITEDLTPSGKQRPLWLYSITDAGHQRYQPIDSDCLCMTEEHFIRHLKNSGRVVFDKTGVSARQIVMHHIPPQFLPDMIEEAGAMLRRINEGKLQA